MIPQILLACTLGYVIYDEFIKPKLSKRKKRHEGHLKNDGLVDVGDPDSESGSRDQQNHGKGLNDEHEKTLDGDGPNRAGGGIGQYDGPEGDHSPERVTPSAKTPPKKSAKKSKNPAEKNGQ